MSQPETRIGRRFQVLREEGRSGLVTFLTAGDPDPDTALEIFKGLPAAGADLIEIGMPFSDPTGGFKCFRRAALEAIDLGQVRSNGYSFQIELTHKIWRQGLRIGEVPIVFTERMEGQSKMSGNIVWEAIWMVWRLLFQNGLRRWPRKKKS